MIVQASPSRDPNRGIGRPRLGLGLTAILMLFYFGFIGLGAFAPEIQARPRTAGGTVTVAFANGQFVIALGGVLTGTYVLVANRGADR